MKMMGIRIAEVDGKQGIALYPVEYDAMERNIKPIDDLPVDEYGQINAADFINKVRDDMDNFMASSVIEMMESLAAAEDVPGISRYATAYATFLTRIAQQPNEFIANMLAACLTGFVESIDKGETGTEGPILPAAGTRSEPGATGVD